MVLAKVKDVLQISTLGGSFGFFAFLSLFLKGPKYVYVYLFSKPNITLFGKLTIPGP